jgi:hypothetical protein
MMRIVRIFHDNRLVFCLGLIGLLALASGCDGGDPNSKTVGEPTTPAQQSAEKDARVKAYGPTGVTTKAQPKQ